MFLCIACSDQSKQASVDSPDIYLNNAYRKVDSVEKKPEYLDQNWDTENRMMWRYTSQGSRIVPYKWFLALEQSDSKQLIRAKENLEGYRFIAAPGDPKWNPDGLPIGFVADTDNVGVRYFGVTCAACHTGKVAYKGKGALVEGGAAHHDFDRFITQIAFSLQQTVDNNDKFKRFAALVLGRHSTAAAVAYLKKQMSKTSIKLGQRVSINHPPHPNGYGRLDAFGTLFNELAVFALNEPGNASLVNAPVSFPVLWDTPQYDVVQWSGSAVNAGVGAYVRNLGEAVGAFGDLRLQAADNVGRASIKLTHHININNLNRLNALLAKLWSPLWPEQILPVIDQQQVERGKPLFAAYCMSCHANINRNDPERSIKANFIPVKAVGTDSLAASNRLMPKFKTGILEGQAESPLEPNTALFGAQSSNAKLVSYVVSGILGDGIKPEKVLESVSAFKTAVAKNALKVHCDSVGQVPDCQRPASYKARPLNGIWASAPYLHNGSVPNLWELLQKPEQRVKQFNVGSWEMDPVKVGFVTRAEAATSLFNTLLPGNANTGHDYGTALGDAEKWALIEYLKTL